MSGGADETVRLWSSGSADARTVIAASATRTNLRACRDGITVVPVVLGPSVDPVWAPAEACAPVP